MGGVRAAAMLQGQSLIKEFIGNQGFWTDQFAW